LKICELEQSSVFDIVKPPYITIVYSPQFVAIYQVWQHIGGSIK